MAIFNSALFKGISGCVGNVIPYKLGKRQIARGKPGFINDAKTEKQLKQRTKIRTITKLRRNFVSTLKVGYCTSSGKECANRFIQDNVQKVNADDLSFPTIDLLTLSLSGGNLQIPLIAAEVDEENRLVIFHWEKQPLMPFMAKDDRLMGTILEREEQKSRLIELGFRGESGEKRWTPPTDWNMKQLTVYGFAVSKNGKNASTTLGLIETKERDIK